MSILLRLISSGFMIPGLTQVFLWIDSIIYYVADLIFRAFFEVVKLSGQLSALDSSVGYITKRVMVLAGVYALFRLSLTLINYLIDPDKINKLTSQGTSIVKNIVIALILLISTPYIFSFMGNLQNKIIDSRVIPKIIYGANEDVDDKYTDKLESKRFVNNMFLLFFNDNGTCDNYTAEAGGICGAYKRVAEGAPISILTGYSILGTFSSFEYTSIFSGIFGLVLCYYFFTYVISMAIRIVQLIILQLLSPIPIIMSIDPAKKDQVTKYAKTYFEVYIQLFIRLLTVYLVLVACGLIANIADNVQISSILKLQFLSFKDAFGLLEVSSGSINGITKAIIYIGILKGGKEIPKLLERALGIKVEGTGFNGFVGVIKSAAGGYVGGIGGTALGVAGAKGTGFGNMIAAGLIGGASGATRGAAIAGKAKTIGDATAGMVGNLKGQYGTGKNVGALGFGNYVSGWVASKTGGEARLEKKAKAIDRSAEYTQTQIDAVSQEKTKIDEIVNRNKEHLNTLDEMDSMRAAIGNSFDNTFEGHGGKNGYIADKLSHNSDYQAAVGLLQDPSLTDADRINFENIRDTAIENAAAQYDSDKLAYIEKNKDALQNGGDLSPEYADALKEYNEACITNNMPERQIKQVDANAQSFVDANGNTVYEGTEEYASVMNDEDRTRTQQVVSRYEGESRSKSQEISDLEVEKKHYAADAKKMREESQEAKNMAPFNNKNK